MTLPGSVFPLAVWLQDPRNAARFMAAGINLYVGLWQGPTEMQLATLARAGMPVICEQNAVGLAHRDDPGIVAWMHGDEPDNAQALPAARGYGPPVHPDAIAADYARLKAADPGRPVWLNLGQGVAWDGWYGRGIRTGHPEDYAEYAKGADIVSFDIYPVVAEHPDVRGRLWLVAEGVRRLAGWAPGKPVWACLEASRISNTAVKPTPAQLRYEAWSALIAGARGLVYFVHQFEPTFVEASLLEDPVLLAGVTALNREIQSLAPALLSPPVEGVAEAVSDDPRAPILFTHRRAGGADYLFVCTLRDRAARVSFGVTGLPPRGTAEILGERRTVPVREGRFSDRVPPLGVRLYRLHGASRL